MSGATFLRDAEIVVLVRREIGHEIREIWSTRRHTDKGLRDDLRMLLRLRRITQGVRP